MKRMIVAATDTALEYEWYEANPDEWVYWPANLDEDEMLDVKGGSVYSRAVNETMYDDEWPDDEYKWVAYTEVNSDDWPVVYGEPEYFVSIDDAKRYIEDSVK